MTSRVSVFQSYFSQHGSHGQFWEACSNYVLRESCDTIVENTPVAFPDLMRGPSLSTISQE